MRPGLIVIGMLIQPLVLATVKADEPDMSQTRAAITRSLALLTESGRTWIKKSGCVSCHHHLLPAQSVALARRRGFAVSDEATREWVQTTLTRFGESRELLYQGPNGVGFIGGAAFGASYAMFGLAAAGVAPNSTTDAMAHYVAARQLNDGHFRGPDPGRMPLEGSEVTATALAVRALQVYSPPTRKSESALIISRAQKWLRTIQPQSSEDRSFQVLGLKWAGADAREISRHASMLAAEQRPDGGWSQLATLPSDAYATGQALVALHDGAAVATTSAAYRKGIAFLLRSQHPDGSWHVISRARGTQAYFESGFPYGTDQFISAAGTAWATTALLLSLNVDSDSLPQ